LSSVARRRNNAQCSTSNYYPTAAGTVAGTVAVPGTVAGTVAVAVAGTVAGTVPGTVPGTVSDDGTVADDGDGDFGHAGAAANFDSPHASPRATFCRWLSCRR
jgi:hypothetical protein